MSVGTSKGAYYEDQFHMAVSPYLDNPNSTPDNNELSPNAIMPPEDEEPHDVGNFKVAGEFLGSPLPGSDEERDWTQLKGGDYQWSKKLNGRNPEDVVKELPTDQEAIISPEDKNKIIIRQKSISKMVS